jgi:hypothetical protein
MRYLGLRFVIAGKLHYGWARLDVTGNGEGVFNAVLTGYAYETVANKGIVAGRTKGPAVIALEPGSLGALAAGHNGRR